MELKLYANLLITLLLIISQCSKKETDTTAMNMHPLISGFTSGTISRVSSIRSRLTTDIVEADQINKR